MRRNRVEFFLPALFIGCCIKCSVCGDHPDGISQVTREQDTLGNYRFSYSVANHEGEQFRSEGTDLEGRVVGSYGLKHADGRHRVVDYVADKDGFRAAVRSNEPGLASAEAADASIVRTDPHVPLTVAATSDDAARQAFGTRLRTEPPRVAYALPDESKSADETPIEQRNFDDYRPLSPSAYYPDSSARGLPAPVHPGDASRVPRVLPEAEEDVSRPLDVYMPPIDPHTAVRRPAYFSPRGRDPNPTPTSSRRPYIPPYGGFDDDPLPEDIRPGPPATPTRSGIGTRHVFPSPPPTPAFGGRRFPPRGVPDHRDTDFGQFPIRSGFPGVTRSPEPPVSGGFPSYPRPGDTGVRFNPPSYPEGVGGTPNFVLRAVPIPNGIQAVKVDPNTGRVYERLVYPLFLRQDGQAAYDRNILLHNDDVPDDDRDFGDPGYFDTQFSGRPYSRGVRDQPSEGSSRRDGPRPSYNRSHAYSDNSLNEPTARDLEWVGRQLSLVDGFDRGQVSRLLPYVERSLEENDEFFNSDHPRYGSDSPSSRIRSLSSPDEFDKYSSARESYSRTPRGGDGLLVDNSDEHLVTERQSKSLENTSKLDASSKDEVNKA